VSASLALVAKEEITMNGRGFYEGWNRTLALVGTCVGLGMGVGACGAGPRSSSELQQASAVAEYPASQAMTDKYGIVKWRAFVGLHEVVVTGFDANDAPSRGVQVALFREEAGLPPHVRVMMLDGTGAAVRTVPGGASLGGFTNEQVELAQHTIDDWDQAGSSGASQGPSAISPCGGALGSTSVGAVMWGNLLTCDPSSPLAPNDLGNVLTTCGRGLATYQSAMDACRGRTGGSAQGGVAATASLGSLILVVDKGREQDTAKLRVTSGDLTMSGLDSAWSSGTCLSCSGQGTSLDVGASSGSVMVASASAPSSPTSDSTDAMTAGRMMLQMLKMLYDMVSQQGGGSGNAGYAAAPQERPSRHHPLALAPDARTTLRFTWEDAPGVAPPVDLSVMVGGDPLLQVFSVASHPFARAGLDTIPLDPNVAHGLVLHRTGAAVSASVRDADGRELLAAAAPYAVAAKDEPGVDVILPNAFFRSTVRTTDDALGR